MNNIQYDRINHFHNTFQNIINTAGNILNVSIVNMTNNKHNLINELTKLNNNLIRSSELLNEVEQILNNQNMQEDIENEEYINSINRTRKYNRKKQLLNLKHQTYGKFKKQINYSPMHLYHHRKGNNSYTTCSICLSDYNEAENVCLLKCNHLYHKDCIYEWGTRDNSCPLCKKKIQLVSRS